MPNSWAVIVRLVFKIACKDLNSSVLNKLCAIRALPDKIKVLRVTSPELGIWKKSRELFTWPEKPCKTIIITLLLNKTEL